MHCHCTKRPIIKLTVLSQLEWSEGQPNVTQSELWGGGLGHKRGVVRETHFLMNFREIWIGMSGWVPTLKRNVTEIET